MVPVYDVRRKPWPIEREAAAVCADVQARATTLGPVGDKLASVANDPLAPGESLAVRCRRVPVGSWVSWPNPNLSRRRPLGILVDSPPRRSNERSPEKQQPDGSNVAPSGEAVRDVRHRACEGEK